MAADDRPALDQVRREIDDRATGPYLVTVTAEHTPHCGSVDVRWDAAGTHLLAQAPSSWPGSEANGRHAVSILWPPAEPGGYSLIVDGTAVTAPEEGTGTVSVTLTRAVLYRRGAPSGGGTGCTSDCRQLFRR